MSFSKMDPSQSQLESFLNEDRQRFQKTPRFSSPASFLNYQSYKFTLLMFLVWTVSTLCIKEVMAMESKYAMLGSDNFMDTACTCADPKEFDESVNYFPGVSQTTVYATDFSIEYFKHYKIIKLREGEDDAETLVLYQCGTPRPEIKGADKYFQIPVQRIGFDSSTTHAFINLLGQDKLVRVASPYTTHACIQKAIEDGDISQSMDGVELDVFFSGFGKDPESNITVYDSSTSDPGVVSRMEWIEFFAAFLNLETPASLYADELNEEIRLLHEISEDFPVQYSCVYADFYLDTLYFSDSDYITGKDGILDVAGCSHFDIEDSNAFGADDFSSEYFNKTFCEVEYFFINPYFPEVQSLYQKIDLLIEKSMLLNCPRTVDNFVLLDKIVGGLTNSTDVFGFAVVKGNEFIKDLMKMMHPSLSVEPISSHSPIWARTKDQPIQIITSADCTGGFEDTPLEDCVVIPDNSKDTGFAPSCFATSAIYAYMVSVALMAVQFF